MSFKILFVYPNLSMSSMVPQSIAILSSVLKKNGFETDVFDTTFYDIGMQDSNVTKVKAFLVKPYDFSERGISKKNTNVYSDLKEKVNSFQPSLIAISIVEDTYALGNKLLSAIHEYGIPVVAGGVFCTYATDIVAQSKYIDYIIRGEGEYPLLELCQNLQNRKSIKSIANLCYRDDGVPIVKNPIREPLKIDELPIADYSIFEEKSLYRPMNGKIYRTVGIETKRGCAFTCGYCCSAANNRLYLEDTKRRFFRKKSMLRFAEEISHLVETIHPEFVYFLDDVFLMMSDEEFDEFCEIYSNYKIPFFMNTRAETVTERKIEKLEELNCIRANIGLEHGNEEFRMKVIKRKIKNEEIVKAIAIVGKSNNISTAANNIIGFPTETRELVFDTINLNRKISDYCDSVSCFIFAPYHGTDLRQLAIETGSLDAKTIADSNTLVSSMLKMPQLPDEALRGLQRTFSMYVRFPKSRWDEIRIAEKFTSEGNKMNEKLSLELKSNFSSG